MPSRMRPVIVVGTSLALVALLTACAPASALPRPTTTTISPAIQALPTEGYLLADSTSTVFLARDAGSLSTVGIDGVVLLDDGTGIAPLPDAAAALVATAHAKQLTAELLVSNFSAAIGDFSSKTATHLLSDPAKQAAVVAQVAAAVTAGGFDGVQVDLESLATADGAGLSSFVQQL